MGTADLNCKSPKNPTGAKSMSTYSPENLVQTTTQNVLRGGRSIHRAVWTYAKDCI